jgi:hypothetical protein
MGKAFIDEVGLDNIKKHKYVSGVYTPIDKLMGHWWELFVLAIPKNVAPNVVTLTALILTIMNTLLFLYEDTTLTKPLPVSYHYLASFIVFMY